MKKKKLMKRHDDEKDPLDQDLSELIKNSEWKPFSEYFQFAPKDQTITLRISKDLLQQYKKLAKEKDTKYQKLIREALIDYLQKKAS